MSDAPPALAGACFKLQALGRIQTSRVIVLRRYSIAVPRRRRLRRLAQLAPGRCACSDRRASRENGTMTSPEPTEAELQAQLVKLSRSRQSGTRLQAQVAATNAVLRSRQREREALERSERELERQQKRAERQQAESDKMPDDVRQAWLPLDLLYDMASALRWHLAPSEWRAGSQRVHHLETEAQRILDASDPCAAFEQWRAATG